jgi:hypothetical protein
MQGKNVAETIVSLIFVILLVVLPVGAQKNKPVPGGIPLQVVFDDTAVNLITSDRQGPYFNGTSSVRAELLSGNFYFDTNTSSGAAFRNVYLQFPFDSGCLSCPSDGLKDVYIATAYTSPNDSPSSLGLNASIDKHFAISWAEGQNTYALRWDSVNYPEHGFARFTCSAVSLEACTEWIVTPSPNPVTGLPTAAGLYVTPMTKKATTSLLATVNMPFVMTLTRLK